MISVAEAENVAASSWEELQVDNNNNNINAHQEIPQHPVDHSDSKVNRKPRNKQQIACEMCKVALNFDTSTKLCEHLKVVHRFNAMIFCPCCGHEFASLTQFDAHMCCAVSRITQLPTARSYKCTLCQKILYDSKTMDSHILNHYYSYFPKNRPYLCTACNTTVFGIEDFFIHYQKHHVVCNECGGTFERPEGLYHHYKSHHSADIKCGVCDVIIKDLSTYLKHIDRHGARTPSVSSKRKRPGNVETLLCFVCDEYFSSKDSFLKHFTKHVGGSDTGGVLVENKNLGN